MIFTAAIAALTITYAAPSTFYHTLPSKLPDETILPKVRTRVIVSPPSSVTEDDLLRDAENNDVYWGFRKGIVSMEYEEKGAGVPPPPHERTTASSLLQLIRRHGPPARQEMENLWQTRRGSTSGVEYFWRKRYLETHPTKGRLPRLDTPD